MPAKRTGFVFDGPKDRGRGDISLSMVPCCRILNMQILRITNFDFSATAKSDRFDRGGDGIECGSG
jgi:hypothetical protein